jgi:hypothetical protein
MTSVLTPGSHALRDKSRRRVFRNSEEVGLEEGVLSKKWRFLFLKDRDDFFG